MYCTVQNCEGIWKLPFRLCLHAGRTRTRSMFLRITQYCTVWYVVRCSSVLRSLPSWIEKRLDSMLIHPRTVYFIEKLSNWSYEYYIARAFQDIANKCTQLLLRSERNFVRTNQQNWNVGDSSTFTSTLTAYLCMTWTVKIQRFIIKYLKS